MGRTHGQLYARSSTAARARPCKRRTGKTVKIRSCEDPDDFLYKKDRCPDRLNSVTPKEGPSDRRYEDIILQCLPPEYDRTHQTHFEREDCNLADIQQIL